VFYAIIKKEKFVAESELNCLRLLRTPCYSLLKQGTALFFEVSGQCI
jgi:hypothetical protein